jgi:hypothetical protein
MRRFWLVWLTISYAFVIGACGGASDKPAEDGTAPVTVEGSNQPSGGGWTDGDPIPPPMPSTDPAMLEIDWTGITNDADKVCSGSWEYDAACCATNWQYKSCFYTPNPLTTLQKTVTLAKVSCSQPTKTACWPGCPAGWALFTDPMGGLSYCQNNANWEEVIPYASMCNWTVSCAHEAPGTCLDAALVWLSAPVAISGDQVTEGFPAANLDFYSAIVPRVVSQSGPSFTWAANEVPIGEYGFTGPYWQPTNYDMTCTIALDHAPDVIRVGRHSSCFIDGSNYDKGLPLEFGPCPATYAPEDLYEQARCGGTKVYSAPGLSKHELMTAVTPRPLEDARYPLACTTCEDKLFGATGSAGLDAQAKYACIESRLSQYLADPDLPYASDVRDSLIGHAKLVFEYKGDLLTSTQRDHAFDLYMAHPRTYEDYGGHWTPPVGAAPSSMEGRTEFCTRMEEPHVTPAVLESSFSDSTSVKLTCVDDALAWAKGLPPETSDRQAYIDGAREASVLVLQKFFSPQITGTSEARKVGIQERLWLLGRWYDQAKSGVYVSDAAGSEADKLFKDTSVLAGTIWKSLYKDEVTAIAATAKTDMDVAAHLAEGMAKDRELLLALLSDFTSPYQATPAPPLVSAPALYFLADGFRTMSERLEMISPYHDVGCRFLECVKTGKRSQTTALHRILGNLHDPILMADALARADALNATGAPFSQSWSAWRDVLELVRTQHASVVQPAVRDAISPSPSTYAPELLLDATDKAIAPLAELSAMINGAGQRSSHFEETGLLESKLAQVQNSVIGAQSMLTQRIAEYQGTRAQLATSLIQEIQNQQTQIGVDSRLRQAALRMMDLSEDDENLKVSGSIDAERFSQQGRHYEQLMRTLEGLGQQLMQVFDNPVLPASFPGEGRYTRNGSPIIGLNEVALIHPSTSQYWKVTGDKGHVVNLSVSGRWAPTCALQALGGSFQGIPLTGAIGEAQTGPEGYEFTYSGSSFSARQTTRTRSRGWSLGASLLGSISGAAGPASAALQATASYSMSSSRSTSTTTGTESRSTAAFQLGVRLANTPFPDFPAGSLLAVMVPPGSGNPVPSMNYDIQVVQAPVTTIVFTKPADLFLVVNDARCEAFGEGNLTLQTVHLVPASEKMEQLGTAMQTVHASFRQQADAVIAQGRLLPSQMAAMREEAWQGLREMCACDLSPYPEAVRGFFGTWIDHEIVHIEREVELMQIRRELQHQMLDAAALRAELGTLDRQGRYARLLPLWSLRNLTFTNEYVRDATDNLARMVGEELYPFIHLRYQDVLDGSPVVIGLLTTDRDKLERLIELDWQDDTLDTIATRVKDATTALSDKLAEVINKDKASCPVENSAGCNVMVSRAVVRFPNPYRRPFFEPFLPPPGKAADEVRSAAVWDSINAYFVDPATAPPIHVPITFEDLYATGTTNASIGCKSAAPVIRAMALYVVTSSSNASTLNSQEVRVPTWPGQMMKFPGAGDGIATYRFDNNDWLVPRDRVLYGEQVDALGAFLDARNRDRYAYSEGTSGISPFSSDPFEFAPLGVWGDPNGDATELMLIMELESRTKSGGVKGVDTCSAPTMY